MAATVNLHLSRVNPSLPALKDGPGHSSPQYPLALQAGRPHSTSSYNTPVATRPVGSFRYSSSSIRVGSKFFFRVQTPDMFGQLQPLSSSHGPFMEDTHDIHQDQERLYMPDHNELIRTIVERGGSRQNSHANQLRNSSPPYPVHDQTGDTHSRHRASFHQPTAEDFLRPQRPLPLSPLEVHDSDQDLPIIKPDSYLQKDSFDKQNDRPAESNPTKLDTVTSKRRSAEASNNHDPSPGRTPTSEHPKPESTLPSHHAHVQSISSDTYQPALGGLQKITGIHRKESKREKFKRAMNQLNPLRCQTLSRRWSRR